PGHLVKWTTHEKALVARQVKCWQDAGDKRVLSRLIIEAQELVLEADRRRPATSIQTGATKHNDTMIADGLANLWLLKDEERKAAVVIEQEPPQEPAPHRRALRA